jgi:hypothetical protein
MRSLSRPLGWVAVAVIAVLVGQGKAEGQPKAKDPPKKPLTVMQRKLKFSQQLLESLALNQFDRMTASATELQQCAREASWRVVKTQKYELYSNDFIRQLENLQAAAKKKNTDAAALAYVEVTLTCVKCHQHIREEGVGAAPDLSPLGPRAVAGK